MAPFPQLSRDRQQAGRQPEVIGPKRCETTLTAFSFVDRYNQTSQPFTWKFTATDLTGLLRRISEHEQPAPQQANLTAAA